MSGLGSDLKLNCTSGVSTLTNCFFWICFWYISHIQLGWECCIITDLCFCRMNTLWIRGEDQSTIARDIQLDWPPETDTHTNNLPRDRKGYDKSKTTYETLSMRRIDWCGDQSSILSFGKLFWKISENAQTSLGPRAIGCAPSKALIRRSQVLLRCLSLAANWFLRKPNYCVSARKLRRLISIGILSTYKQKLSSTNEWFLKRNRKPVDTN